MSDLPSNADVRIYNREAALKRLGHDEDLYRNLVQFFLEDSTTLLNDVRKGLADGNFESVARAAHSLKGLASNFDAAQVVASASQLQSAAEDRQLSHAATLAAGLDERVGRLRLALAAHASSVTTQES